MKLLFAVLVIIALLIFGKVFDDDDYGSGRPA